MSIESLSAAERTADRRVLAIVQVLESALDVRRRHQFFVWTQGSLQLLLPHKVAVCGFYDRGRKQVRLEVFNSIVVPAPVLEMFADGQSTLMQYIVNTWIDNRGRPLVVQLSSLSGRSITAASAALESAGFTELLVHGVSRPQRASEIETLFVFASPKSSVSAPQLACSEMLLPYLHSTYLRVQSVEREIKDTGQAPTRPARGYTSAHISERECQVLAWVREGMSNQEIGAQLGISPLTVKNHVQKILHKLGANNRAQAVARAMSMNLLVRAANEVENFGALVHAARPVESTRG